ncbi:LANO_0E03862g1_1 [Lachancea nothofagi CBS 11611]|uniref:tRNA pseudouridine synthase 1 n=1 Tax=Lachancea nothofagi CBS 11611 TaxID=1266666 RepID=A0A1G4JRX7_9SACH|nr:LANO_0E03862g1_1 [Lachancea nothofagi CBS 11611]
MSENDNLKPAYEDDQPGEDAYKRGNQYKWTKARKADYEGSQTDAEVSNKKAKVEVNSQQDPEACNPENKEKRLPKRKVSVMIGYCGTGYHGMQYNPPSPTIEAELFRAFVEAGAISQANSTDLKKSGFMRAARTDKGVHAGGNVISLKLIIEDPDIISKINSKLPEGIRIWDIERVNKAFDCRKMCSSRWYEYLLPTYSLIGPKPGSALFADIEESKKEFPGVLAEDQESAQLWANFFKEAEEAFTTEELESIKNYVPPPRNEFDDSDSTYQLVKIYKQLENKHRRAYRISTAKLDAFRASMKQYLGPHNFFNFTLGKEFKDPSAVRFMKEIKVSEPFVIGEKDTEWVSIKIHGQSFMLHQIRKMISMATLVTRCACPTDRILDAYKPQRINIPKAPALGLLLECPVYEGYNKRLQEFGYNPIDFSKYQSKMDAFKMKHIYDKIYQEEVSENVFNAFFSYIDNFSQVTGAQPVNEDASEQAPANATKPANLVQKSVFDFLTARGIIDKTDGNQAKNDEVISEKTPDESSQLTEN